MYVMVPSTCLVMTRYLQTSLNLKSLMMLRGFSCPSTVPCCIAVNSSVNAGGRGGAAPKASQVMRYIFSGGTRSLRPFRSSIDLISRLQVRLRLPR